MTGFLLGKMNKHIRNIAVIAHVDHGKTTLVDALLKQTNVFRDNQEEMGQERLMDSQDLERERGITILAKICSVNYQDHKINIIDTPGHADFSGEVERTLGMADGALLIVDAAEGPMPQTRYVLKMAMDLGLKILVVINKIDKKLAQPEQTKNKIEDLFLELAQTEEHLHFTTYYAVARNGSVFEDLPQSNDQVGDVTPLLNGIINHINPPTGDADAPFKLAVSSLDSDDHLGRIIIGKINQGSLKKGQSFVTSNSPSQPQQISKIMTSQGMQRIEAESASSGDIVSLAGISKAKIGDTLCDPKDTSPLPTAQIAEPTMSLKLGPNTSPFSAKEGVYTTSRQLGERLQKELENNVSLRVITGEDSSFKISGRGELHLAVFLETMRREGYEMEVGKPEVIVKKIDGITSEPIEEVHIVVPEEYNGVITTQLGKRQGELVKMNPTSRGEVEYLYRMPTRAIIGLRSILLTLTKGTLLFSTQIIGYQPVGESLPKLRKGAIIAAATGKVVEYGLKNLKGRGVSFVKPGDQVYEGMIIGLNAKDEDIEVNVCKEKNLTNHRTKSHQGITQLAADVELSLEESLDTLEHDELLEITPQSLRLRKKHLTNLARRRADKN